MDTFKKIILYSTTVIGIILIASFAYLLASVTIPNDPTYEEVLIEVQMSEKINFEFYLPYVENGANITNVYNSLTIQNNPKKTSDINIYHVIIQNIDYLQIRGIADGFKLYSRINSGINLGDLQVSSNNYLLNTTASVSITYFFSVSYDGCHLAQDRYENTWGVLLLNQKTQTNVWGILDQNNFGIACY